jgi:Zn-dependent peptidase ImmA (M78 family)/transcriptional regulator with XRE-family HTH domain
MARSPKMRLNNPELLVWARETAGYDVTEIAHSLGCSPERVHAWERGDDSPSYAQLKAFANKVKRPIAALYLPTPPPSPPPPEDFRQLPEAEKGQWGPEGLLAFREMRNRVRDLRDVLAGTQRGVRFDLPAFGLDADIAREAATLREALGVPVEEQLRAPSHRAVLSQWRDALFGRGVTVHLLRAPLEDFRGFSLILDGLAGIALNARDADAALNFSLFHEVPHLCLRRPGVSGDEGEAQLAGPQGQLESFCNRFAAEFLLPATSGHVTQALRDLVSDLSTTCAQSLGRRLKVSKYALLRRAAELGYVSDRDQWETYVRWRSDDEPSPRRGAGGPTYYTSKVAEYGRAYVSTVFSAVASGALSAPEATHILGVKLANLDGLREKVAA